jgi:DNA-binding GntR family transcriptional regulator
MLPKIERDRVVDDVYTVLRQNILQQTFGVGERLHVDELAEQLNVSRTPVREALNLLAVEKLVNIVPRSGTFVTHVTVEDVEEIFDLRYALEGHVVEQLARRALDPNVLCHLRAHFIASGEKTAEKEITIRHAEANRSFHEQLISLAGNRRLAQIYGTLNAHTMMASIHYASPDWRARQELERNEHAAILAALEQQDPLAARRAVEQHIQRAKASLIEDVRSVLERTSTTGSSDRFLQHSQKTVR